MMPISVRVALASLVLVLAGCAHRAPVVVPPPPPPAVRSTELAAIVAALDRGDVAAASPRIDALLARDPADPQARMLRDAIDRDPVALLGARSFAYRVKPGETMTALAERFLGDGLQAFALARYNRVAVPAALAAGTMLRMPGVAPPRPAPPRAARARPRGRPAVAMPRLDPVAARQARAGALAALSQGRVDAALAGLRRAAALDPGDPLIRRDLARASRLAAPPTSDRIAKTMP